MNVSQLYWQGLRVLHFASRMKNLLKFRLLGVQYGKHFIVHGNVGVKIGRNAQITIGDNFYYSSGDNINPLCATDRGCLCANNEAKIVIGYNVAMSSTRIWAHKQITIGDNVLIGGGCTILDSNCHSLNWQDRLSHGADMANKHDSHIVIEDNVLIGMNSMILKGVTIGARSVIGAGSVVTKSIPADCIAAGNPAKVVKTIENNRLEYDKEQE